MHAVRSFAAVAVAVGVLTASGTVEAAPAPSMHGSGMVILPAPFFDDVAGDPVRFELQVQDSPSETRGTFNIVHLDDAGGLYAHIVGDVNCASIVDGVAFTTGIIRKAWLGGKPALDLQGTAAAITVEDGGGAGDTLGFNFEFFGRPIQPCQHQAVPPFLPVDSGNFTVRSGATRAT